MKKILLVFTSILLLLVGYYTYVNIAKIKYVFVDQFFVNNNENDLSSVINSSDLRMYEEARKYIFFAGQNGFVAGISNIADGNYAYLIKGKLLDPSLQIIYDKIPDTIQFTFATGLYHLGDINSEGLSNQSRFIFYPKYQLDSVSYSIKSNENSLGKIYAKMVYEGKAEGYRVYPEHFSTSKYFYSFNKFQSKYGDHFLGASVTDYNEIDYPIKEVLLDFFNSDEGQGFGFNKDQRSVSEVFKELVLTQSGKNDICLILNDNSMPSSGENKEVLLVISYNPESEKYSILHKHFFNKKIVMIDYYYFPALDRYQDNIYEDDSRDHVSCVVLQASGEDGVILKYNKEFDKIDEISQNEIVEDLIN